MGISRAGQPRGGVWNVGQPREGSLPPAPPREGRKDGGYLEMGISSAPQSATSVIGEPAEFRGEGYNKRNKLN